MSQDKAVPPNHQPRLIISKIVCENFKSYAGVKELGPFHKCFSAIIGPNGSGKSNVIDAMLFVFGYRAKKIRSKSVSVLMHNSENHQNITSCTVTVHFQKIIDQDGVDFTVVPGSHFRVSRTAFKDNSSYYQLNGRKVPFKEISCLLKEAGIDLDHNRFLILQGEVEQIALMKPKAMTEHDEGMLEFLEDIIGTSQYKEPIEELGTKLEELQERRGEKLNRVKVVENEKSRLEGAKNEAEEYLKLKHSLSVKQYRLYEHYKHECKQLEAQALEKKGEMEVKIQEVNEGFKESKQKIDDMTTQRKKLLKKREKFSQTIETCKNTLNSCEQEDVRVRQEIKNNKNQLKKTKKNLEKEKEKLVEYENAPEKCQKQIEEGKTKLKVLEARKSQEEQLLSEIMSSLKEDTQSIQDEKEEYENRLVGLCQTVNEVKSKFEVANSELELYKERCSASERKLKEDKLKLETIRESVTSKDNELRTCESSLIEMDSEISSCKESLKVAQNLRQSLPQLMKMARNQIFEAQSQRSRSQIMDELMKQKHSGAIPGICGRLGDLGTIPDKYDVAVSTACPGLDYCVVDTMETAVKCVEFLKRADLGTATFIAIDKMERHRANTKGKASGSQDIPRLFDLITPKDDKYLTCFYHVMGEMLVAKDLDQATKIGLQGKARHNVVTLQGQLINQSGAMTGGGTKPIKGRMSSKLQSDFTPEQLNSLRTKLESQEASYEKSLNDCSEMESKLSSLEKKYSNCRKRMGQLEKEIQIFTEQEKGTGERIKQLQKQGNKTKTDPKHLARLEKEVEQFQKEYDTATVAADEVKSIVRGLTEEIMRIGGSRISEQQKLIDKIKKELEDCSTSINKASVAIKSSERNAKKSIAKIESLEGDVLSIESKLEGLYTNIKELEDRAKEAIEKQQSIENTLEELNAKLSDVIKELQGLEGKQKETNELLLDLKHEMEAYTAKVKENQGKIKHFNNEIAKLSLDKDLPELQEQDAKAIDKQQAEYEITMLDENLKQMSPNLAAIDEYKKKEEILESRKKELDLVTMERDNAYDEYDKLRLKRHTEFMTGFTIITDKLKQMYQMITLGGDAELELMDSMDPFAEGIVFSVRPPKKSWKNISNLSGGEKTLSSLALVFALHHYKPSPLYVMDEIDAALDFKNVSIVAHYIKERTKNAQFIIISLRSNMFELADRLVGIYKTHNCTKSVTVDPRKMEESINSLNNH